MWSLRVLPKFDKTQSMLKRIRNCHCFWPINFWLVANWPGVTAVRTKQPLTLINKLSTIWKNSQVSQVLLYYMTKKETSVSILTCTAVHILLTINWLSLPINKVRSILPLWVEVWENKNAVVTKCRWVLPRLLWVLLNFRKCLNAILLARIINENVKSS